MFKASQLPTSKTNGGKLDLLKGMIHLTFWDKVQHKTNQNWKILGEKVSKKLEDRFPSTVFTHTYYHPCPLDNKSLPLSMGKGQTISSNTVWIIAIVWSCAGHLYHQYLNLKLRT